jgi:hypothetical protein
MTAMGQCPVCQAGNCVDCRSQTNCSWYTSSLSAESGKCAATGDTPSGLGTYAVLAGSCPICNTYLDCPTCNAAQNTTGCSWWTLPGNVNGKCREASPSFAYTKVAVGFCNGNSCGNVQVCSDCQNVIAEDNVTKPCAWFSSKLASVYNSKCDVSTAGVVDTTFYNVVAAGSCPVCGGSSCVSCKAEANCKWVAVDLGVSYSFGQCLSNSVANPAGKTVVATCPAACQVHSCKDCVSNTACRWFSGSSVSRDVCDLSSDSFQHPFHTVTVSAAGNCPACVSDRCFECGSEAGCGWYKKTFGLTKCDFLNGSNTGTLVQTTDANCEGNPNSVSALVPSLASLVVAFFVYHN